MSNELERERALREYLDGGSRLSRAYGAMADEEPGPEIDNAVLQQAHAAVAPGVSRWKRIAQPLALAATVVMTVSVVITMQGPEITSLPSASAPAPDAADPFAAPVAAAQRAAPARDAEQKAAGEQALPQAVRSGQALPGEVEPLAESVDAVVQGARPTAVSNSDIRKFEESRQRADTSGAARQDAVSGPAAARYGLAEEADASFAPAPPATVPAQAVASERIRQGATAAMADEAQEMEAPARLRREQKQPGSALATAGPPPAAESAALSASAVDGDLASMQMAEPFATDDGAFDREREPESWLEEIRDLVADGAVDQARTELKDFLEVYPDYPLDDTLSTLKPR